MKIEIRSAQQQKNAFYLPAHLILRYLITDEDKIDTLVCCKSSEIRLKTHDYEVYKALGSIKSYDNFVVNKLTKLFEVVDIDSFERTGRKKPILTDTLVEEIRTKALKVGSNNGPAANSEHGKINKGD